MKTLNPAQTGELCVRADAIVRPKNNEPCIVFIPPEGKVAVLKFDDMKKRDDVWYEIERKMARSDLVSHRDMLVRPECLKLVERRALSVNGALRFVFRSKVRYLQYYDDDGALGRDHARLSDILGLMQDRRTTCPLSSARH